MLKKSILFILMIAIIFSSYSCHSSRKTIKSDPASDLKLVRVKIKNNPPKLSIDVGRTDPEEFVTYAEQFVGVKYLFGGTDPKKGFDCSGFLFYVFNHFGVKVPRTSELYTNAGKEVEVDEAQKGDLILFTGSDHKSGKVGHIGIIVENKRGKLTFLHAASGGGKGISYSGINSYFAIRFVKIIRIFS